MTLSWPKWYPFSQKTYDPLSEEEMEVDKHLKWLWEGRLINLHFPSPVLCDQISLGDAQSNYLLTTAENELGVVVAHSESGELVHVSTCLPLPGSHGLGLIHCFPSFLLYNYLESNMSIGTSFWDWKFSLYKPKEKEITPTYPSINQWSKQGFFLSEVRFTR